ncbi:hypothetical protein Tco_0573442 [Tanacetum coccineum]
MWEKTIAKEKECSAYILSLRIRSLKFIESSHSNAVNQLLECYSRKCLVEQCMLHYLHGQLLEPPGLKKSHLIYEYDVSHFSIIRIPDSLNG